MSFTGKAVYVSDGSRQDITNVMKNKRERECLADLIGIISPYETPLLDAIGDPLREAKSVHHEWMEDSVRKNNRTQEFTAKVEVSGTDMAASQLGLADEIDYQKQERLRELLRDLENTVINGTDKMKGIIPHLESNVFEETEVTEAVLNKTLRQMWENSSGSVDMIVVGGRQKRKINAFCDNNLYISDFGACRIICSRWTPQDAALLLDSSRLNVIPLAGKSFYYKPLASNEDSENGEVVGEYTLELKNEESHGIIKGLN